MLWGYKLSKGHFLTVQSKKLLKGINTHQTTKQRTGGEKNAVNKTKQPRESSLQRKTGYYEIWNDGRRFYEILTTDEDSAIKDFTAFAGETWEPTGEQGSK